MDASTPFASPRRAPVQGERKGRPVPIRPRKARGITDKMQWGPWGQNAQCVMHNAQRGVDRGIAKNAKAGGGRGVGGMREEGSCKNISKAAARTRRLGGMDATLISGKNASRT